MTAKQEKRGRTPKSDIGQSDSKPKTITAKKLGLSLTISDKTLKEFDRIQEKTIKIAEKDQNFSWR